MNMTPTREAMGMVSMRRGAKRMKAKRKQAAEMPESRPRPPELMERAELSEEERKLLAD
jgi:hypothetical protein